jgi:Ser/Thr protein kinase RdoA (MazF antagonist)
MEAWNYYEKNDPQLPQVVIHGDYAPYNVVFSRRGIEAVLDFGDANLNLRAADVARGLSTFSKMGRYGINLGVAQIFLKAFQERQPLSYQEVSAIPDLIRWRYLSNIIWSLFDVMERHPNHKSPRDQFKFIRERWEGAVWIKSHYDKLRSALLS